MPYFMGIDTSNYTTSVALYNSDTNEIVQHKKLLPVKNGKLGLRQSDAVFHHTIQLPEIISAMFKDLDIEIKSIAVSTKPRNKEGSYMPCFLVGKAVANSISSINKIPLHETSHQIGHILSALHSCDKVDFINNKFLCFHVSGGTTDMLLVEPSDKDIIKVSQIGGSLDLKAGQVVDRVGLMLGLQFPCGIELEKLALNSNIKYKIKPTLKNLDCCLSGVENQCVTMHKNNISKEDIARYCLEYIKFTLLEMSKLAVEKYGEMPIVFAGGVMSNSIIREEVSDVLNCYFAKPEFSCDNAAGVALYTYLRSEK